MSGSEEKQEAAVKVKYEPVGKVGCPRCYSQDIGLILLGHYGWADFIVVNGRVKYDPESFEMSEQGDGKYKFVCRVCDHIWSVPDFVQVEEE